MTVAELIKELQDWDPDREVYAGSNDPQAPRPEPVTKVNFTYGWLLTEPRS